jgi:hypothetical protein
MLERGAASTSPREARAAPRRACLKVNILKCSMEEEVVVAKDSRNCCCWRKKFDGIMRHLYRGMKCIDEKYTRRKASSFDGFFGLRELISPANRHAQASRSAKL